MGYSWCWSFRCEKTHQLPIQTQGLQTIFLPGVSLTHLLCISLHDLVSSMYFFDFAKLIQLDIRTAVLIQFVLAANYCMMIKTSFDWPNIKPCPTIELLGKLQIPWGWKACWRILVQRRLPTTWSWVWKTKESLMSAFNFLTGNQRLCRLRKTRKRSWSSMSCAWTGT